MRRLDWAENCGGGTALLRIACSEQVNDEIENMGQVEHTTQNVHANYKIMNNELGNNIAKAT